MKPKAERDVQRALLDIAVTLCRHATGDCVMDEDDREPCNTANCRMMRIAEGALIQAKSR